MGVRSWGPMVYFLVHDFSMEGFHDPFGKDELVYLLKDRKTNVVDLTTRNSELSLCFTFYLFT
jgi:hypothetical protein